MGNALSNLAALYDQSYPPKPRFSIDDIPDLTGKVIIVTGGNTGVGKETVKALLKHNAKVYMAARSQAKADQAIAELEAETGKAAVFLALDLARLDAIKQAVAEFTSKETQLHILFNNGGVMVPPLADLTSDGYDLQFGTNCLGHFYFTKLLLPTLISTARSAADGKVRVVTTSSSTHMFHGLDFDTFRDGPARIRLGVQDLYSQSKFGNVVFARELARRYADQGVVSIAVNPGNLRTELQRHVTPFQLKMMNLIFLWPAPLGALTQLWGGTAAETADYNGEYLIPWARLGKPHVNTTNPATGERLWAWLEEQVAHR